MALMKNNSTGIGGSGFLCGGKVANVNILFVHLEMCMPLLMMFKPRHAFVSRFVLSAYHRVLHVLGARSGTKVCPSVVLPIAVDVVNVSGGPSPGHVEPRETVVKVAGSINADPQVVIAGRISRNWPQGASVRVAGALRNPGEYSSLRVVVKKFAQALRGKIGLSHDALLMLIGQRPASADNASGLRYFRGYV